MMQTQAMPSVDHAAWALFLDIDGTLLDLAPTPGTVVVPKDLPGLLEALTRRFGGALALVSGRSLESIDSLFPGHPDAVGCHGAEWRLGGQTFVPPAPWSDEFVARIEAASATLPGVVMERKALSLALHFRAAQEQENAVRGMALAAIKGALPHALESPIRHVFLEYAELMLFLLAAMTYVNSLEERRVFDVLRAWLVRSGFGYRALFWLTGTLAFFISPVADNLTTALVMCAVVLAVGKDSPRFVAMGCVNIVVAANAGGAFSPFGDITTLMVWQKGMVQFNDFFRLFLPSVVNFLVPAALMHLALPTGKPEASDDVVRLKPGAWGVMILFALTIVTAICFHNYLHLPPVIGMMTGLGYLLLLGYYLMKTHGRRGAPAENLSKANLERAHLHAAILINADLSGANLTGATLTKAFAMRANFKGANMSKTYLQGADFSGATWTDGRVCAEGSVGGCK